MYLLSDYELFKLKCYLLALFRSRPLWRLPKPTLLLWSWSWADIKKTLWYCACSVCVLSYFTRYCSMFVCLFNRYFSLDTVQCLYAVSVDIVQCLCAVLLNIVQYLCAVIFHWVTGMVSVCCYMSWNSLCNLSMLLNFTEYAT